MYLERWLYVAKRAENTLLDSLLSEVLAELAGTRPGRG
jgi:hypothetical protein